MKASIYLAIPLMVVLGVIQTAVLPHFSFRHLSPQLPLLVALAWGMLHGLDEGMVWAFIGGISMDLFSITPLGITAISYLVAVTAVLWLQQAFPTSRLILPVLLAAVATTIFLMVSLLLLRLTGFISTFQVAVTLWPLVLLNAIAMLPVYWFLYAVDRTVQPQHMQL